MSIYTLHQHPDDASGADLVCLPDRFNWFAALLPPFWAAANGLWKVLALMLAVLFAMVALGMFFTLPVFGLYLLGAWWLGFEASNIHSRALVAKGWGEGVDIIASDALLAEQAYFTRKRPKRPSSESVPPDSPAP